MREADRSPLEATTTTSPRSRQKVSPLVRGQSGFATGRRQQQGGDPVAVLADSPIGPFVDVLVEPEVGIDEPGGEDAVHGVVPRVQCRASKVGTSGRAARASSTRPHRGGPGGPAGDPSAVDRLGRRCAPTPRPGPPWSGGSPSRSARSSAPRPRSGEVDGGRVEALLEQPFGHVERPQPRAACEGRDENHELVHPGAVERDVVGARQPVGGASWRSARRPRPPAAGRRPRWPRCRRRPGPGPARCRANECIRPMERAGVVPPVGPVVHSAHRHAVRQERDQALGYRHRTGPGPPPPWGVAKVLCRFMWTMSKPMSTGPGHPEDGVEVGAVVVEEAADLVDGGAISTMSSSKRPRVLGLVSMMPATSSSSTGRRAARSTQPRSSEGTVVTS